MSYGGVENTQEELDLLRGATITDIRIEPVSFPEEPELDAFADGEEKITMRVKLAEGVQLQLERTDGTKINTPTATFEIWQDEEGNGPGYIALVGD